MVSSRVGINLFPYFFHKKHSLCVVTYFVVGRKHPCRFAANFNLFATRAMTLQLKMCKL